MSEVQKVAKRGRPGFSVSLDNYHEIILYFQARLANKKEISYETAPEETLYALVRDTPYFMYTRAEIAEQLASVNKQSFDSEELRQERINNINNYAHEATPEAIQLLDDAIKALDPKIWKKHHTGIRQFKNRRANKYKTKQITISRELFFRFDRFKRSTGMEDETITDTFEFMLEMAENVFTSYQDVKEVLEFNIKYRGDRDMLPQEISEDILVQINHRDNENASRWYKDCVRQFKDTDEFVTPQIYVMYNGPQALLDYINKYWHDCFQ